MAKKKKDITISDIARLITEDPNVFPGSLGGAINDPNRNLMREAVDDNIHSDYTEPGDQDSAPDLLSKFFTFLNALVGSASHGEGDEILKGIAYDSTIKGKAFSTDEIKGHISEIEPIEDLTYLRDFIKSKPSRVLVIVAAAKKVFGTHIGHENIGIDSMIIASIDKLSHAGEIVGDEKTADEFYYDEDSEDSDGH